MSKVKMSLLLSLLFCLGCVSGYFLCNLAQSEPREIVVHSFSDYEFTDGIGDETHEMYPPAAVTFAEGFELWPTEDLFLYKYEPLPAAAKVSEIINDYFQTDLTIEDYWRGDDDGYANYFPASWSDFSDAEQETWSYYALSANRFSGKFSLSCSRSDQDTVRFAREYASYDLHRQYPLMENAATDFVKQFAAVTGKLHLDHYTEITMYDSCFGANDIQYEYSGYIFYFAGDYSVVTLPLSRDLEGCLKCSDSEDVHSYFTVTVRPDGSIQQAENYITQAVIVNDGTQPPLTRDYLEKLSWIFTSAQENDTLVYTKIKEASLQNYFGYAQIEPFFIVEYYFQSQPEEIMHIGFVHNQALVNY